jgi:hypothetical protein
MEPIKFKYGPYRGYDHSGNPRWFGILPNGKKTSRARLVMMNFLHCENLSKVFHVHHEGDTEIDEMSNLLLMSMVGHGEYHEPCDYSRYGVSSTESPAAYQRARYADITIREERLTKRRKYYQEHLKNDPVYQYKNQLRANAHHLKTRKGGKENEN